MLNRLASLLLVIALPASAATYTGKVVGISDGDTVTVLDDQKTQYKIRLMGIDAPEKKQPYGQSSKERLSDLIFGKTVSADCKKKDRYSRDICVIFFDGKDVNLEQVKSGMAWWYQQYSKEQTKEQRAAYEAAERAARDKRLGLWADAEPTAPWDWRHKKQQ